jgi:hypothetical protein
MFEKKNRTPIVVVKFYQIHRRDEFDGTQWLDVVKNLLLFLQRNELSAPSTFEIEYGESKGKSREKLFERISQIKNGKMMQFIGMDREGYPRIWVDPDIGEALNWDHILVETGLALNKNLVQADEILEFMRKIRQSFQFEYAYLFNANWDFNLSTEKPLRRTFWGSDGGSTELGINWNARAIGMRYGFLRNVYPCNFLPKTIFDEMKISEFIIKGIGYVEPLDDEISGWFLTESELINAKRELGKAGKLIAEESCCMDFAKSIAGKKLYMEMTGG